MKWERWCVEDKLQTTITVYNLQLTTTQINHWRHSQWVVVTTHTCYSTHAHKMLGQKIWKPKKKNHERETMTISDKSKLEVRNQTCKENNKKNISKRKENCKPYSCKWECWREDRLSFFLLFKIIKTDQCNHKLCLYCTCFSNSFSEAC